MKLYKSIFTLLAIIFLLMVVVWFIQVKGTSSTMIEDVKTSKIDTSNWILYTNKQMGFALNHPRTVNNSEMVFFEKNNILFVTTASSTIYLEKEKLNLPTQSEVLEKAREIEGTSGLKGWAIIVYDAQSMDDLNRIIQEKYNNTYPGGCKLGEISSSTQEGVFDVSIDPVIAGTDSKYDSDSSCWINSRIVFKYSSIYKLAAIWDMGQAGNFLMNCKSKLDCEADLRIAESFRFIPRTQ